MEFSRLASLALLLVASIGTTGCGYRRYHARYVYVPVRPRVVVAGEVAAPGYAAYEAPPAAPAAPPPPAAPAPAAYGSQPIVVRTHGPGTTIIVVNPPSDRPAVGVVQGAPPPMAAPASPYYAPAPAAAPPVQVAPPPPAQPQPEEQGGWNE